MTLETRGCVAQSFLRLHEHHEHAMALPLPLRPIASLHIDIHISIWLIEWVGPCRASIIDPSRTSNQLDVYKMN